MCAAADGILGRSGGQRWVVVDPQHREARCRVEQPPMSGHEEISLQTLRGVENFNFGERMRELV